MTSGKAFPHESGSLVAVSPASDGKHVHVTAVETDAATGTRRVSSALLTAEQAHEMADALVEVVDHQEKQREEAEEAEAKKKGEEGQPERETTESA